MWALPDRNFVDSSGEISQPEIFRRNLILGTALGIVIQMIGCWALLQEGSVYRTLGLGALVAGTGVFFWGFYCQVRRKGFSWPWTLLGWTGPLGLVLLAELPDDPGEDRDPRTYTLKKYQVISLATLMISIPAFFVGYFMIRGSDPAGGSLSVPGMCLLASSFLLYIIGIYFFVKRKGRHWVLAILGVVGGWMGLFILTLFGNKKRIDEKTDYALRASAQTIAAVLFVAMIILMIDFPRFISCRRTYFDRCAARDATRLGEAIKKFTDERAKRGCTFTEVHPDIIRYMVGPYYGWQGTTASCRVKVTVKGDEVRACSMKGLRWGRPEENQRYLYGVRLSDGSELPVITGPCSGKPYGTAGDICYTESILNPDCSFRKPGGIKCRECNEWKKTEGLAPRR
jgi:hypothetical protein